MRQHPKPRPRDDRDTVEDIARDLAEIASHLGQLKGDAHASLSEPNYDRLKLRLENALSLRWRLRRTRGDRPGLGSSLRRLRSRREGRAGTIRPQPSSSKAYKSRG
jgi:hypothetical protein